MTRQMLARVIAASRILRSRSCFYRRLIFFLAASCRLVAEDIDDCTCSAKSCIVFSSPAITSLTLSALSCSSRTSSICFAKSAGFPARAGIDPIRCGGTVTVELLGHTDRVDLVVAKSTEVRRECLARVATAPLRDDAMYRSRHNVFHSRLTTLCILHGIMIV